MGRDYFSILGLTPGRYAGEEIARRFDSQRRSLLAQLDKPGWHDAVCQRLDELHLAYAALRDPEGQVNALRARDAGGDRTAGLRLLIAASLEDGLLRHSRRQQILREARQMGLSDFQTHLLIAQVQFGDDEFTADWVRAGPRDGKRGTRAGAGFQLAAAGMLAAGMFLALVRWLTV